MESSADPDQAVRVYIVCADLAVPKAKYGIWNKQTKEIYTITAKSSTMFQAFAQLRHGP